MGIRLLRLFSATVATGFAFCFASPAAAQEYPSRPVKILIAFAPGGPSDIVGRLIAQKLTENFGNKPFLVENRPGAGGNIGIAQVAKSAPDGYTLLLVSSAFVINPSLYANAGFDALKDFTPVTLAVTSPNVLITMPSLPVKDLAELIALVKASPGKYDYASPGPGTGPHLSAELMKLRLQLDLTHVPYNGGGPAVQAVLAGQVPIGFSALPPAVPHIKAGKLRALAVTSSVRAGAMPDIPTVAEAAIPDFEGDTLQLVMAPAGTPAAIVGRLQAEIARLLNAPELRERLVAMGFIIVASTPEQTGAKVRTELDKWARVVKAGNIKPE